MHGRHYSFLDLKVHNPKIEYSLSKIRANKCESKKKIAEEQNPPKQLTECLLSTLMIHLQVPVCPLLWGHLRLSILSSK